MLTLELDYDDDLGETALTGLPTADLPASACLSSRLPYGTEVTSERLQQVEDGEARLRDLGFRQVRLRHHGPLARIEIAPDEIDRALERDMTERMITAQS